MIDKGQRWEFGQDTGVTPLLFTRSAMGFLMTTESQDLGLTSHLKDGVFGVLIDSIYVLIIILNPIHSLFSAFCSKCCLFLYFLLFMRLTHVQVFNKIMHEA